MAVPVADDDADGSDSIHSPHSKSQSASSSNVILRVLTAVLSPTSTMPLGATSKASDSVLASDWTLHFVPHRDGGQFQSADRRQFDGKRASTLKSGNHSMACKVTVDPDAAADADGAATASTSTATAQRRHGQSTKDAVYC